jgi:small GTP-binding protein
MKIGVFGPTNSGKSSLVGRLAHKISAVSAKAHTTSEVVNVVKSYQVDSELGLKNVQLNYFDAPGLVSHKGGFLSRNWDIIKDIDFALLVLDSNKRFEEGVRVSIERLEKGRDPSAETPLLKALVLNKIDLVNSRNRFSNLIAQI